METATNSNIKCLLKLEEDDDIFIPVNSFPFNPSFDGIINPGLVECQLPGTVYLRNWIRLQLSKYKTASSKFLFRASFFYCFHLKFNRGLFFINAEGLLLPVISPRAASSLTYKVFARMKVRNNDKKQNKNKNNQNKNNQSTRKVTNKKMVVPLLSTEGEGKDGEDVHVHCARQMHRDFAEQFSTPELVHAYSELFKEGSGHGKYAVLENDAYGSLLELHPEFADDEDNPVTYNDMPPKKMIVRSFRCLPS
jgi:hypothetical protein